MVETNQWFIMIYFDTTSWLWISYRIWVQPPKTTNSTAVLELSGWESKPQPIPALCYRLQTMYPSNGNTWACSRLHSGSSINYQLQCRKHGTYRQKSSSTTPFCSFFWFLSLCLRSLLYRSSFDAFFGLFQRILDRLFYSRKIWDMMQVLSWRVAKLRHANTDSDLVITGDGVNLALPESGRVLIRTLILISNEHSQFCVAFFEIIPHLPGEVC